MKRYPAIKIPLYVFEELKQSGDSYFSKDYGFLNRVRVMGRVVSKFINEEETYGSLVIDDGTGTIRLKFFGSDVLKIKNLSLGALVDVVGRIKEFKQEIYVNVEAFSILKDMNWELLRILEIYNNKQDEKEIILNYLRERGRVSFDEINELIDNAKEILDELKLEGSVFEPEKNFFEIVEG